MMRNWIYNKTVIFQSFRLRFIHEVAYSFRIQISLFIIRAEGNKSYPLKLGSDVLLVYCHMTDDLGACGSGGWTLATKVDCYQVYNYIK